MAVGKIVTGFSKPYVALYAASSGSLIPADSFFHRA